MTRVSRPAKKGMMIFQRNKLALAISAIAFILIVAYTMSFQRNLEPDKGSEVEKKILEGSSEIMIGKVDTIPYYHCNGSEKHLVLLHGARFTKEDWKSSGIMKKLCTAKGLSVSAMDLPVSKNHDDLQKMLRSMEEAGLLELPISLVTPSASGKTVADWIASGDVSALDSFVSNWIPVAPPSVGKLMESDLRDLKQNSSISILAVYGSRDAMGAAVSQALETNAGATKLQIEGGHPCYLDSPDAFVAAIFDHLNIDDKN